MPQYVYECEECGDTHQEIHSIREDPEILCPECGTKCFRVIQPVTGYVRGNCYLKKGDCKKAAEIATLQDNDPYGRHRVPGEKDELINKLKNSGKNKKTIVINGNKKVKKTKK
jgi:putative FmdB family regulatory protein